MKIAIVTDFLVKLGGAERVVKKLVEMYPDADIYTLLYDEEKVGEVFPKEKVKTSFLQKLPKWIRSKHKLLFPLMPTAIENLDMSGYDLVISSSSAYAHGVITNLNTRHITYCHSPMRYAWDYTHKYLSEQRLGFFSKIIAGYFLKSIREWDVCASKRCDKYIANSQHVAKRIEKFYRRESEVIYPPVDIERFKVHKTHEDFFLIVSTLTPYKKIELAVQLFNKINKKLVIIGEGPAKEALQTIANDNIDFVGFKNDKEVTQYLEKCRAFIFPGEEDFGIAPVEAMACGKPVLAYRAGGLLETVVEGKSGEFFSEQTVESMEDALGRLLLNEKFYDADWIRKESEKFSSKEFEKHMKHVVDAT